MEHWKNLSLEDLDGEVWKPIKETDGAYMVSNNGRVKSNPKTTFRSNGSKITSKGRIIKQQFDNKGYLRIRIIYNDIRLTYKAHRLVAQNFKPNPKNKSQVNHIDGCKSNNELNNLEWNTPKENIRHASKNGLRGYLKGEDKPQSKLKESDVRFIKDNRGKISGRKLSEMFSVNRSTIINIYSNKIWKHI